MPWFFVLAAPVAYGFTRVAIRINRGEGRKPWQALLMRGLGRYPVLMGCLAQFIPDSPR